MRAGGEDAAAALRARNCLGATALYEAVRYRHVGVVDLLMSEAPELSALPTEDGSSPLYLAAAIQSLEMVKAIVRPSLDGTTSPASYSGPEGRTALHAATFNTRGISREIAQEILNWEPEGPALLTKVDSSGRTPLHLAIRHSSDSVIDLFLNVPTSEELARMSDNHGSFPVHVAAIAGRTAAIDKLAQKCPDFYEMVDAQGRNLLHCAVQHNQYTLVRYICQNDTFSMLLNAVDYYGNTPLHLAAKYGFPGIVSLLLQTMTVKSCIANKDGLTAQDLAIHELLPRREAYYILSQQYLTLSCLRDSGAIVTLDGLYNYLANVKPEMEEASNEEDNLSKTGTIGSVLIATVAFAAAFTVPGGFVADDHPSAGAAVMARRFAFRAFAVSDTLALGRREYYFLGNTLLPLAALLTIAAFAFGFHLVLGAGNRGLLVFVYTVCLATVLLGFPDIWVPWHLGLAKAIWRRTGWRGLVKIQKSRSSLDLLRQLLFNFPRSFLFRYLAAPLFVAFVSATFVIAIALNIALPNY
ncbi:hypothetical protein PVAP13_2KG454605 [Panicum virgatum]|uniref:PGG domain-containing protein n=1 Tax=Panicum virgatum TaxID=38727 RepID=A0A8T0WRN0_PANVG|nr:hypothetical protein PVAP13_2KG454605 [Panicum virgatum]